MRWTGRKRAVAVGVAGLVVGGAFGPPLAAFAGDKISDVIVKNTPTDPVLTKAVGRTEVSGVVGLADGTKVALADGTKVGLTDGTKVLVDQPIRLADDASVKINNNESAPVPVQVVDDGRPGAQTTVNRSAFVRIDDGDVTEAEGPLFTVPDGKVLVITGAYGWVTEGVVEVVLAGVNTCVGGEGQGAFIRGTINGTGGRRTWALQGEPRIAPGCELWAMSARASRNGVDSALFDVFGYLTDA